MERFETGAAYLNFLPARGGEEPVRAAFGADANVGWSRSRTV